MFINSDKYTTLMEDTHERPNYVWDTEQVYQNSMFSAYFFLNTKPLKSKSH
jgi:hypothetical protein